MRGDDLIPAGYATAVLETADRREGSITLLELAEPDLDRALAGVDLSPRFGAFLPAFGSETLGAGGRSVLAEEDGRPAGLLLVDPVDDLASIFTRFPHVAEVLLARRGPGPTFVEAELPRPRERFDVFAGPPTGAATHRFRHPPHVAGPEEMSRVVDLLREVYGRCNERWFASALAAGERCVAVDLEGTLAGAAWILASGSVARLHSLTVRAGYRGLGLGADLLAARLWLAHLAGAEEVISEISERNGPSRRLAERAGLRPAGAIFLYEAPGPPSPVRPGGLPGPLRSA